MQTSKSSRETILGAIRYQPSEATRWNILGSRSSNGQTTLLNQSSNCIFKKPEEPLTMSAPWRRPRPS